MFLSSGAVSIVITKIFECFSENLPWLLNYDVSFDIPLWVVIAVSPAIIYAVFMPSLKLIKHLLKYPSKYTRIKYGIWELEWGYKFYKDKSYEIINLHPICCKCKCGLTELNTELETVHYCPICKDRHEPFYLYDAVHKVIDHNIVNKEYKYDYSYEISN